MRFLICIVAAVCLFQCGNSQYLRYCRKRNFNIDVVVAYGITPIPNVFPHNLYRNGGTPSSVSEFTRVLLTIFDYRPTKVALVSFNEQFRTITGFNQNKQRLWTAFSGWKPRPGRPVTSSAIHEIRNLFSSHGRSNSRRLLVLVTDRMSAQPEQAKLEAAFARSEGIHILTVGYDETYKNQREILDIAGKSTHTSTVSSSYFLPGTVGFIRKLICGILKVSSPTRPPPPVTAAYGVTTTVSPITDEIVVLADDSESTRDFSGIDYFYNNDTIGFINAVIANVDFGRCRVALYLFSGNTRGLFGNLTTNQSALQKALDSLKPEDNAFSTTNTAEAISQAALVLTTSGIPTSNKYIVLLTDGQPDDLKAARESARAARGAGIKFGILLAPLFDGQISYRPSDITELADVANGDVIKVLQSRSDLATVVSSSFCPVNVGIFN